MLFLLPAAAPAAAAVFFDHLLGFWGKKRNIRFEVIQQVVLAFL